MSAELRYLKIDLSMPDAFGKALWLPTIQAATPEKGRGEERQKHDAECVWSNTRCGRIPTARGLAAGAPENSRIRTPCHPI
jgi:hypothetical protein